MQPDLRIGIDVGGTNTDAAVLDAHHRIVARTKTPTTPDVTTGIRNALSDVTAQLGPDAERVRHVMLGTTHATNAVVERHDLARTGVVRIGSPAGDSLPPTEGWPDDLRDALLLDTCLIAGGNYIDGRPLRPLDHDALDRFLHRIAPHVQALAITSVFAPSFPEHETEAAARARAILGHAVPISLSHQIGALGLLERENATILNAALHHVASRVTDALTTATGELGLNAQIHFVQNDGTLMDTARAARFPVLTIGSGPANSVRGAAVLSGITDGIVADVGGTTTDLSVLVGGYPRQSTTGVTIGGIRLNSPMPDTLSIPIGGGTRIHSTGRGVRLGPDSLAHRINPQALAFGGTTLTLSDAAVHGARLSLGTHTPAPDHAPLLEAALAAMDEQIQLAIENMITSSTCQPLVLVGGAAPLIARAIDGVSQVHTPPHSDIACAVGAASAHIGASTEHVLPSDDQLQDAIDALCDQVRLQAIEAGADPDATVITHLAQTPMAYLTNPSVRLQIRAAGPLTAVA
ncbi:hydantoinase/oxoprolinase N-terminal domain-containing protein [Streptacidiphilus rugosus]|uniref:hydantoinase/oxoprolinase N-terminal domain-containing protein n=1 Tax=Streptacidiphilus rugosus TaxID=405783 RepID=UPI00056C727D|nr:hydantoinase/oxoprolinase family protein [Streptacidiphilus rugosus]